MLALCGITANAAKNKELYVPMDYSTCGYHASEARIPDVPNVVFVGNTAGDCSDALQRAIDYVGTMKPDNNGLRGAVLLREGTYNISKPLRITASGVVLRGQGIGKTVIRKTGVDRGAIIYIKGTREVVLGDTTAVTNDKVMAGSTSFAVASTKGMAVGGSIEIVRPSTKEWIESLKCDDFGGGLDYTGWKPGDIDITWKRTITAIDGNTITIDAPITTTLDKKWGNSFVTTTHKTGMVTECGVENLTIESEVNDWNAKDEDHAWDGVWLDDARDCWVRRCSFVHLAGSAVNMQKETSRITVEDCISQEPVSEIGGWRRSIFLTRGQQNLVQRCVSKHGIHDFVADFCAAGPNAFVQCEAQESMGFSGSIGSWAAGLLFDIVDIDGNDIRIGNLEQFQMGTGWNSANSMLWQCTGSTLYCYSPDEDNRSSANGCWGTLIGNGEWTNSNNHVNPRSLFYSQLEKRLGDAAVVNGYVLPRNTTATTSPTVEEAMRLAKETLTEPRLTLEMWIDSVPYNASTSINGVKDIASIKQQKTAKDKVSEAKGDFAIINGKITVDGKMVVGNMYSIPWWNGRVKDSFKKNIGAKPAITRFVPGREGLIWTDCIDETVDYLKQNGFAALDQHYGLWYDLRRTDHERVRRADGNVEPPFYDQPFSRSGKGQAWDGLSLYDIEKPNKWYWHRLNEFAEKGAHEGMLLFNENYFQHNILEAGAHWVDCPWRPVNNIGQTDGCFPEPVPFTGDKRIFVAEQFYDINNAKLRNLHRNYIRMCLEQLKDRKNVVQFTSDEYTGPLHFTQFWLKTIEEWENETGNNTMTALSCCKDAQDAILNDPIYNKVVDVIDIRYWHYKTDGLWAPKAGQNLAPRQHMRKLPVGKTTFEEVYRAVKEYSVVYKDKVVTYYGQQYSQYGWAVMMAGGSLPNIPVSDENFLIAAVKMRNVTDGGDVYKMLDGDNAGALILAMTNEPFAVNIKPGKYRINMIDAASGEVKRGKKVETINEEYKVDAGSQKTVIWLERQ
ncbi:MAG: pectate lyase [Prevotella sp.]|nr:pectate lyase [Prevotella sp.]